MTEISTDNRFEWDSNKNESRYFGLGCIRGIVIVATSYNNRIRLISARIDVDTIEWLKEPGEKGYLQR